jgi:Aminoglycoside-2''-adenylyltransferase
MTDLALVLAAADLLESYGARTWVFGGWAEELRGLAPPRDHRDVDLLYPAPRFDRLDALDLRWIEPKRLAHKRAFVLDETMVEVFLVQRDADGWFTEFARVRHHWPPNVFAASGRLRVASAAALIGFRAAYGSFGIRRAA